MPKCVWCHKDVAENCDIAVCTNFESDEGLEHGITPDDWHTNEDDLYDYDGDEDFDYYDDEDESTYGNTVYFGFDDGDE